ncbi:MAG: DNA-3-methyladenine glycosylase I [Phycisphaerales bacterium]|nr:MAG: DNA-3-methyladenine glycosylase I [Phycisphaerales bacterium]
MTIAPSRCPWAKADADVAYHDAEWGVPIVRDEARLFEMITLEGAQAGLSWSTILKKREGYRRCFAAFDADRVARFTTRDVERLVLDASIVRHRGKVESTIHNAKAIVALRNTRGPDALSDLLWSFVDAKPVQNAWRTMADVPAKTPESVAMSKALQKAGFRFVGPTTCYALMQAAGLVNDHLVTCPRHAACADLARSF